jgi:hypothetical protein
MMTDTRHNFSQDITILTTNTLEELSGQLIQIGQISSTKRWNTTPIPGTFSSHDAAANPVEEYLAAEIEEIGAKYVLYGQKFSAAAPDGRSGTV